MTTFLDLVRKAAQERKRREYIIKGGKGSGWYAPPRGTHTAGAKAGAKTTKYLKGLSKKESTAVASALKGTAIQPEHLENLTITTKPWAKRPDWEVPGTLAGETKPIAAIYDPDSGTVHIKSEILLSDAGKWTLAHEIGHHVTNFGGFGAPEWTIDHIDSFHTLLDGFEKTSKAGLTRMGLREYSLENQGEFMADCFKVYIQGSNLQKRALAKHLGVQDLKEVFGG